MTAPKRLTYDVHEIMGRDSSRHLKTTYSRDEAARCAEAHRRSGKRVTVFVVCRDHMGLPIQAADTEI